MVSMAWAAAPAPPVAVPRLPAPFDRRPELNALTRKAHEAVIARYPELTSGPDRQDVAAVDLVMHADGRIENIEIERGAPGSPRFTNPPRVAAASGGGVQGLSQMAAGSLAPNGERLRSAVMVRYTALGRPIEGSDSARAPQRVMQAVRETLPELLLPGTGDRFNRISVLMTEDGRIARHHAELREGKQFQRYGDIDPLAYAAQWERLGLRADELGTVGITMVFQMPTTAPAGNDPRMEQPPRLAEVLYAWPRRPGEPVGGIPQSDIAAELASRVAFTYTDVVKVLEQLLPGALNERGVAPDGVPWLVMSRDGRVLRSGYIPPPQGNVIGARLLQPQVPDLRLREFMPLKVVKHDTAFNDQVWLTWVEPEP
jgi:hypothetical protein